MRLAPGIFDILAMLLAASSPARAEGCVAIGGAPIDLECRVDQTGAVKGAVALRYRLQSYYDGEARIGGGVAVLGAGPAPVAATYNDTAHYDRPQSIESPVGRLLLLPGQLEGSGDFDASALFALDGDKPRPIDTQAWQDELAKRLPQGLGARKGIYPDYRTMKAETPLWRKTDDEANPTGGHASITLAIAGDKLAIARLAVRQSPPRAEPKAAASSGGETIKLCGKAVAFRFDAASFGGPAADDAAARATAQGRGPGLIEDAFADLCARRALSADEVARRVRAVTLGWAGGADSFNAYFPEGRDGVLATEWAWQDTSVPDAADLREGILCAFTPKTKGCADRAP